MKKSWAVLAMAAAIMCVAVLPAGAVNGQTQASDTQKTRQQQHVQRPQGQPPFVPQNACDYDRAAGRCVIDLGYGRCMECSGGPYK